MVIDKTLLNTIGEKLAKKEVDLFFDNEIARKMGSVALDFAENPLKYDFFVNYIREKVNVDVYELVEIAYAFAEFTKGCNGFYLEPPRLAEIKVVGRRREEKD